MTRELTCIICPRGCTLTVTLDEGKVTSVTGNACPRGAEYGAAELQHPVRVLTSTVKLANSTARRCPVKTNGSIPKGLLFDAMAVLENVELTAPVTVGQVVVADLLGTGVDVVATKTFA